MKKKLLAVLLSVFVCFGLVGCDTEANRVSENLAQEADNFNVVRRVTVFDCITNDTMFVMEGKMSIKADTTDDQLEVVVEDNGSYRKVIVGLSSNTSYIVEDLVCKNVDKYHYTINLNPKMYLPYSVDNID